MGIINEEEYTSQIKKGRKRNMGVNSKGKGKACLLYTSPSPRDRTRSRMPSSA